MIFEKKKLLNTTCVWYRLQGFSETLLILRRTERDLIKTVCWPSCFFLTLDAGLLARSQYSEGPATGHLGTGFSWFPCA